MDSFGLQDLRLVLSRTLEDGDVKPVSEPLEIRAVVHGFADGLTGFHQVYG
jgi:hypothetical protein